MVIHGTSMQIRRICSGHIHGCFRFVHGITTNQIRFSCWTRQCAGYLHRFRCFYRCFLPVSVLQHNLRHFCCWSSDKQHEPPPLNVYSVAAVRTEISVCRNKPGITSGHIECWTTNRWLIIYPSFSDKHALPF